IPKVLILGLNSDDIEVRKTAVSTIRRIELQAVQPVIDAGLVPTLVSLLDSEDTTLQHEAAWILTNIAAGTTQQTYQVVEARAIPKLVTLSASPDEGVAENAVWALTNIVGDSPSLRDRVAAQGGIDAFVRLLNDTETTPRSVQRRAMSGINSYLNPWSKRKGLGVRRIKHLVPLLVRYIQEAPVDEGTSYDDKESIAYATQSLARILDRGVKPSDVIQTGVVPRLVHLLADTSSGAALHTELFACIAYLIDGDERDTDATIDAGLLPALLVHLGTENEDLCQRALWSASNIAAGSRPQAHALLDCGILKHAARILADDQSPLDCRHEACWIISNISHKLSGDVKVVQAFIDDPCVEGLWAALQIPDVKTRELAIVAITNLMQYQDSQGFHLRDSLLAVIQSFSIPQELRHIRDSRMPEDRELKQ
ncbi:Importin alpha subunit (Karyopherin alpha subunit) (Serine-rich RNA polymerase I suppressor protein), partial [Tulasnella sp. 417]